MSLLCKLGWHRWYRLRRKNIEVFQVMDEICAELHEEYGEGPFGNIGGAFNCVNQNGSGCFYVCDREGCSETFDGVADYRRRLKEVFREQHLHYVRNRSKVTSMEEQ